MLGLRVVIAHSLSEIREAQTVRARVYGEEGLLPPNALVNGREVDPRDFDAATTHIVVYREARAIGTVRLIRALAGDEPQSALRSFDVGKKFEFSGFAVSGMLPAEISRFCVLRSDRGTRAVPLLFSALFAESRRQRVTHWVAAANAQTDSAEDANILSRLIASNRFGVLGLIAHALTPATPPEHPARRIYTDEQVARAKQGDSHGLRLPPVLSLFAKRMGARYIGPAAYDPFFRVFAVPLISILGNQSPHRVNATRESKPLQSTGCGERSLT